MDLNEILGILQYDRSPNFLAAGQLVAEKDNAHIYRKAQQECGLFGAYTLRGSLFDKAQADVPVVYVCSAQSDEDADAIHRRVWNQNVVPFLLVVSPRNLRLYSGFRYARPNQKNFVNQTTGILQVISSFNEVASSLRAFGAESVDDGTLWKEWGPSVTPETRVDWKLLQNLEKLDHWLVHNGVDDRSLSHAIIGKFVYLRYLRDRQILSDRKLSEWGLQPREVLVETHVLTPFAPSSIAWMIG